MTSPIKLLKEARIHPNRLLGQNFIKDPSSAEMIVKRSGVTSSDVVLEIGAGLGALSLPLARIVKKLYAVEKDSRMVPLLKSQIPVALTGRVVVQNISILDLDLAKIAEVEKSRLIVFGNLPYNISSQILVRLIIERQSIRRCILMFQKELVQRIAASPGSKDYGRLSVILQYCAELKKIAEVKASLFFPQPKVDSEVVEIIFKDKPDFLASSESFLFKVIKAAFSKRRKMLKNSIGTSELGIDTHLAAEYLEKTGIAPDRRAETLTVQEFVKLSNELFTVIGSNSV